MFLFGEFRLNFTRIRQFCSLLISGVGNGSFYAHSTGVSCFISDSAFDLVLKACLLSADIRDAAQNLTRRKNQKYYGICVMA